MSAGFYAITMDQGATFTLDLIYKDSAGQIIDLTNYTAAMQIRNSYESSTPVLSLTTSNGGISITGNQGKISILATAIQTAAITAGSYVYDLEITLGTVVSRIIQGPVNVVPEVTRA